tara:strand:- start:192 stop:1343 length:1152 start_codon:yes stop_codon:yes gene_type:complete
MYNNIIEEDLSSVIKFLKKKNKLLTQSEQVSKFESEWSKWLGVRYSVYVNSGSSANLITIAALKKYFKKGEIILPPLTWVSDIASVIQNGFKPVFADINPKTLCMDENAILKKINNNTVAVFLTHTLGFNGLTKKLLIELKKRKIILIEDVCESHGACFNNKKLGTYGLMSNFSFFYAHHMSTVEGGMVCTNNKKLYNDLCMLRSHGMIRESKNLKVINKFKNKFPSLNPQFIFAFPAYNVRNTEINAVIGRNQLKRLDKNNIKRKINFKLFLDNLDKNIYKTDFDIKGSCNYAFVLILKNANIKKRKKLELALIKSKIEFRRGTAGGGNQLRQPYLKGLIKKNEYKKFPEVEHIHFYGYYIGNYPDLEKNSILKICNVVNNI